MATSSTSKFKEVDTKTPYSPEEAKQANEITVGPHWRPYLADEAAPKRSEYALPDVIEGHEELWEKFGKVPDGTTSS